MNGLLAELDAPLEVDRLDPFVEPSHCVASLSRNTAGAWGIDQYAPRNYGVDVRRLATHWLDVL
jgi:hypothetical protein